MPPGPGFGETIIDWQEILPMCETIIHWRQALPCPIRLLLQVSFDQSDKEGGGSNAKATFQPSFTINITNCSDHVRKSQVGGRHVQNISSVVFSVHIPYEL